MYRRDSYTPVSVIFTRKNYSSRGVGMFVQSSVQTFPLYMSTKAPRPWNSQRKPAKKRKKVCYMTQLLFEFSICGVAVESLPFNGWQPDSETPGTASLYVQKVFQSRFCTAANYTAGPLCQSSTTASQRCNFGRAAVSFQTLFSRHTCLFFFLFQFLFLSLSVSSIFIT